MAAAFAASANAQVAEWRYTEGAAGGGRYSPLAEIDRSNVGQLEEVWRYRHGDIKTGGFLPDKVNRGTAFESTPLMIDGRLIFTTPFNRVIALDAGTGAERWVFDPEIDRGAFFANMIINRGVAYWEESRVAGASVCAKRVFLGTLDGRLIAIDAATGRACAGFGDAGTVDLHAGLEPLPDAQEYNLTSPPTVVGDVVVVGSSIADTVRRRAPPGDVRGFDARTGALRWTFHTIPKPGEFGYDTWENDSAANSGAANVWTTMTADLERNWVFLPVSTPSPDYFGGDRPGANLFSDSLVVLDAKTGERIWHFQTVHHDLWDYDLASPPNLVTIDWEGTPRDVVALPTKQGFVFVLDRVTGEPVFGVEERQVPKSTLADETSWPTQPFPLKPPALVPQHLTEGDLWDRTPGHLERCKKKFRALHYEGMFTPPTEEGIIAYPFSAGGANWSGSTFDPVRQRLIVPVNNAAQVIRLTHVGDDNFDDEDATPMKGYLRAIPYLIGGKGTGLRYWLHPMTGRTSFESRGHRCTKPPWGYLVAVDLAKGEILWRVPTGKEDGIEGLLNFGPALTTAGGLIFHAGTRELVMRAHDIDTGEVVARFPLPAGLHAGPISYRLHEGGPQYLVIAPGGHVGTGSKLGDYVIAYKLPEAERAKAEDPPAKREPR